jgi:hypothetical protein
MIGYLASYCFALRLASSASSWNIWESEVMNHWGCARYQSHPFCILAQSTTPFRRGGRNARP